MTEILIGTKDRTKAMYTKTYPVARSANTKFTTNLLEQKKMSENTAKYIRSKRMMTELHWLRRENAELKEQVIMMRAILAIMRKDAEERKQMMDDNMINDERNTDWD